MQLQWQTTSHLFLAAALSILVVFSASPIQAADASSPQDPHLQLFESKCQKCHSLERVKEAHLTKDTVKATVDRMKNKPGADISQAEAEQLYEYLGNYFVIPPAPPVAPAPMR